MNYLTHSRRLRKQQQQQMSRPRSRSSNSPRSLQQQQRDCRIRQKRCDRHSHPHQVFTQSWTEAALTKLSLAALLLLSSSFTIALSQISFRPPVKPQSQISPEPVALEPITLRVEAERLFATPDSLGAIAIGVAEGTRTPDGSRTSIWQQHTDPGNYATNQGTFSWQLEATSVADAERRGLNRARQEAIPHLLQAAENMGISLSINVLVQGVDLWNQSPQAGSDFVENLQRCQQWEAQEAAVVLCARVRSYVNPSTGEVEAAGFANDLGLLRDDQRRRMQAIEWTLQQDSRIAQIAHRPFSSSQ